jgi:hypothetical protein
VQALDLGREVDDRLAGRVAAADQRHLLALAQLRLDRRGPERDAGAFEGREVGDIRPAIAGPGGDHHGARLHPTAIRELDPPRIAGLPFAAAAIEPRHLERDGELGAELVRLVERASGQRHARDAGGKAEIVLDPRRGAGLSAERALVEHQHREPLGGGVDRGGEAGRPGADHGDIVERLRIELGRDAEAHSRLDVRGPLEHGAVGAEHQRKILRLHAEALNHGAAFLVVGGVEHGVGIAVAREKALQPHELRRARPTDQHRARAAVLDQPHAAQDEGAHERFADVRRADHQRADMRGVERDCSQAVRTGPTERQGRAAGELADLAGELADAERGDRRLVIEAVAPADVDRALEHQPGRRVPRAHVVDRLAGREFSRGAAGEALGGRDLCRVEHGKQLVTAGIDKTHDFSCARRRGEFSTRLPV